MQMCKNPSVTEKYTIDKIIDGIGSSYNKIKGFRKITKKNRCKRLNELTKTLEFLFLGNNELTNISPLKYFTKLNHLYISDNNISDITPLKYLINLKYLNTRNNKISNFKALLNLKKLEGLTTSGDYLSNLEEFSNLKLLTRLIIYNPNNVDLKGIENIINLEVLWLIRGNMKSICTLGELTKLKDIEVTEVIFKNEGFSCVNNIPSLKKLILNKAQIKDFSFVNRFENLNKLYINNNGITNIDVIKNHQKLETVIVSNSKIYDISILNTLPNLKYTKIDDYDAFAGEPKNLKEIKEGQSCLNKDGTLKSWWKRLLKL